MSDRSELLASFRIEPGQAPGLARRDPGARPGAPDKSAGLERLGGVVERIGTLHARLWAEATRGLLLVLQGTDASGKDGTIRQVLTGVNPQGCRVVSFREPTTTELAHDYLWRIHRACPARGEIVVFDRSHYEDVIAVRVRGLVPKQRWRRRYRHIRGFERLLSDEGTEVVKVFLNVSKAEQGARLRERLDDPEKRWKLSLSDLEDRARFDEFRQAAEDAIRETSTEWAPWYVVPADHNWSRDLAVAEIVCSHLEKLDPQLPPPDPALEDLAVP